MSFSSSLPRWFAVWLLLYTQAALALAPCVSHSAKPASAFAEMPEDCPRQFEANLCLAHCQLSDQSDLQGQIPALPVLDSIVLRLPRMDPMAASHLRHPHGQQRATHPPPLLLLCSLNL